MTVTVIVTLVVAAFTAGLAAGWRLRTADAPAHLLASYAARHGAQWFIDRQRCPGCSHMVHLMRHNRHLQDASEDGGDDGYRCIHCSGGTR
jgi:hypothetical protein